MIIYLLYLSPVQQTSNLFVAYILLTLNIYAIKKCHPNTNQFLLFYYTIKICIVYLYTSFWRNIFLNEFRKLFL